MIKTQGDRIWTQNLSLIISCPKSLIKVLWQKLGLNSSQVCLINKILSNDHQQKE